MFVLGINFLGADIVSPPIHVVRRHFPPSVLTCKASLEPRSYSKVFRSAFGDIDHSWTIFNAKSAFLDWSAPLNDLRVFSFT